MRIAVVLLMLLTALPARAAPPEHADPALAPWFQSLQRNDGLGGCCSQSDCRPVESKTDDAGDWWVNITPSAFENFRGYEMANPVQWGWTKVPPAKILQKTDNPVGRAVACWTPSTGILCFIRPPET